MYTSCGLNMEQKHAGLLISNVGPSEIIPQNEMASGLELYGHLIGDET
jgi:hypothetical protein